MKSKKPARAYRSAAVKQARKVRLAKGEEKRIPLDQIHFHPLHAEKPTMQSVVARLETIVDESRGSTRKDAMELLEIRRAEWLAFVADVKAHGIRDAAHLVKRPEGGYWLMDGRQRYLASKEAGLKDMPAKLSTAADPAAIIVGSLAARRHVSKQLLAYVALDCYPHLVREARQGRPSAEKNHTECGFSTLEALADHIGVHLNTVSEAARVHRLFRDDPSMRELWEWRIYAGIGFQGVLAGAAVIKRETNGKPIEAASVRVRAFIQSFAARLGKHWAGIADEGIEVLAEVKREIRESLAQLPDEAFEAVSYVAKHRKAVLAEIAERRIAIAEAPSTEEAAA